jgi:fumarate reductase flavoprotein subunit
MKHIIFSRLLFLVFAGVFLAAFLLSNCAGLNGLGMEGRTESVYEGAAQGYRGMIRVRVGYENGAITDITVIESREDRAVGGAAMEELADLVLMYITTEIDAVSGATETSRGFLAAVENAIMDL